MKQQFIQTLKNGLVPFSENEAELAKLPEWLFEKFNADLVSLEPYEHRWNENYFNEKVIDLDFNFSKELVLHLIEVKKCFQNQQYSMENNVGYSSVPISQPVQVEKNIEVERTIETTISVTSQKAEKIEYSTKPNLLNFKPNVRLVNFLQEGDIGKIRSYLMSMLNNRRLSLEELFKSIWYVNEYKPSVFEDDKNSSFVQASNNDETAWDIEYFNIQQVYLNKNFSLARLLHLANVRETLMKRGDSNFQQIGKEREAPSVETHSELKEREQVRQEEHNDPSKASSYSTHTRETQSVRPQQPQAHQNTQRADKHVEENGFIKTVAMVGGAVLALAAALFAIFK